MTARKSGSALAVPRVPDLAELAAASPLAAILAADEDPRQHQEAPQLAPSIADGSPALAELGRLYKIRTERVARMERDSQEVAKLTRAIAALEALVTVEAPGVITSTRTLIELFLETLEPGAKVIVEDVMKFGRARGWVCTAVDPRNSLLTRFPKLADQGVLAYHGRADWRKPVSGRPRIPRPHRGTA